MQTSSETFANILRDYGSAYLSISGEVLAEIAQLMQLLYQHKNLNEKQFLKKAEQEIPIKDNFAFLMAAKYLAFKPGLDFISEKYAQKEDYSFPKDEYEYWMKIIQHINPQGYETLRKCEAANGKPCLEMAVDPKAAGIQGSDEIYGYPVIIFDPGIKYYDQEAQKESLSGYLRQYNDTVAKTPAITESERMQILEVIKSFASSLYEAILAVDPTGSDHIKRNYIDDIALVYSSPKDGLPLIRIGASTTKQPIGELRFVIAHELGHFALGHLFEPQTLTHSVLQKAAIEEFKKEKKTSEHLPFKESFEHAYSRTQELEADRFAIIEFGIPIDDAIAWGNRGTMSAEEYLLEAPKKETFKSTHPLFEARIQQFEDLRREVELHKAQKRQPKAINWKELAENYLKEDESK